MTNARRKGHDFERLVAKKLRDIGYPLAATSRYESKSLDEDEVDIANVPFYIQCKAGYDKHRPKYDLILSRMEEKVSKRPRHPLWILHKPNGRTKTLAVTTMDEFLNIVDSLKKYNELKERLKEYIVHYSNNQSICSLLNEIYGEVFPESGT